MMVAALGLLLAQVAWARDLPEALSLSGSGRLVMAHFWRPDCPWCEKLESVTYLDAGFAEVARGVVPVRILGEAGGAPLAEKCGVRGYPTILFLDARGETFGRVQGYVSIDALRDEAAAAADRRAAFARDDAEGATARAEAFAARRDEAGMAGALEQQRRLTGDWRSRTALAAGVFYEEEIRTDEAAGWFLRAFSRAKQPRDRAYAAFGWARTRLSKSDFAAAAKGFCVALETGALFESHRALAAQLLEMSREKAGWDLHAKAQRTLRGRDATDACPVWECASLLVALHSSGSPRVR